VRALLTPQVLKISAAKGNPDFKDRWREEGAMEAFKITLITSLCAFLIGSASVAPDFAIGAKVVNLDSAFERAVDRAPGDPDAPEGYSTLGIAKINGSRVAVYAFQNGAKPDDVAGPGRGFADVFDSAGHLIRRFAFRENLNSPPQITEYVSVSAQ
jgi:hypothetical protein